MDDNADRQRVKLPWQDVSMPLERRVLALLSNMTTEEKISQLSSNSAAIDHLDIPAFNWWTGEILRLHKQPYSNDADHDCNAQVWPSITPIVVCHEIIKTKTSAGRCVQYTWSVKLTVV